MAILAPTTFTHMAFVLNHALDTGNYSYITTADVKRQIREGSIFPFLESHLYVSHNV